MYIESETKINNHDTIFCFMAESDTILNSPLTSTESFVVKTDIVSLVFAVTLFALIFANSTTREFKIHAKYPRT